MPISEQDHQTGASGQGPPCPDPIAIVGMGCRWPGGVRNPAELWELLREKRDGWAEFTSDRINIDGFYHPNGQRPGSMFTKAGHMLQEDPRLFDHSFFGISATEATSMDPSQRKLLEVTYDAVDSAGVPFDRFFGSRTGVFVGNFNNDHQLMQFRDPDHTLPYVVTGGGPTILSNRINYCFNLQGPSLMVDTGCSASMYALHLAILSLHNGDCDAAIVAGGNLVLGPDGQVFTTKLGALSPTSRCHTFDAAADGYSRAEGFGALYLKKLSDARASGDPIRAVVRGTSFNANGKTGGISHPSVEGQEAVIRQAYKTAGLDPHLTGYFECHGTGTPVGDPIEVSAVGKVFASGRRDEPLLIGSIKPNLGHSEPASAMSQIMKAVLSMEHGEIPATIGIEKFNPNIDFEGAAVRVVTEMTPWPSHLLRRVSINSFGYGGANAHCILDHPSVLLPGYELHGYPLARSSRTNGLRLLNTNTHINGNTNRVMGGHTNSHGNIATDGQVNPSVQKDITTALDHHSIGTAHADIGKDENPYTNGFTDVHTSRIPNGANGHSFSPCSMEFPQLGSLEQTERAGSRPFILLPFSAHDDNALKAAVETTPQLLRDFNLSDLLFTLGSRKSRFPRRAFSIVKPQSGKAAPDADSVNYGRTPNSPIRRIGFVFTGQGAQWPEMGARLIDEYAVFGQCLRFLDSVLARLQQRPSWTIVQALKQPAATSQIHDPAFSQTLCTALQIALVTLLRQWGIEPSVTVGHSSGEIAAAYAAGRLLASEAIVLAYFRGLVVATNRQKGLMVAVGLGSEETLPYLESYGSDVRIAAVNSPASTTVSGKPAAIQELSRKLTEQGVFNRILKTGDNAYHSHHMLPLGESYEQLSIKGLQDVASASQNEPRRPSIAWISSVTPEKQVHTATPAYWRQNLESPVLFSEAVQVLAREERTQLLIEIGPHPALSSPLNQIRSRLENTGHSLPPCLGSLQRGEHDVVSMLNLAGRLFISDAPIDLVAVNASEELRDGRIHLLHGHACIDMPQYKFTYPENPVYFENRYSKEFRMRKYPRHDLLGARQPGCSRTHPSWRNVLRLKDLPWLDDHKLIPHAVVPGAAYIAMAVEAARQLHFDADDALPVKSFKLRNVAINSTLRVQDGDFGTETVLNMKRTSLTNSNILSIWYEFSIGSMEPDSGIWTEHCGGSISIETQYTTIREENRLQADPRSRSLDIRRWYDKFGQIGLGYGPTFQGLSKLQAYPGTNIAAADVALNTTAGNVQGGESDYVLHPAALDNCFQLALISCHAGQVENVKCGFVPVGVDEMTIWPSRTMERQAHGLASAKQLGVRSLYARTQLYSASGYPLLDIGELKCVAYEGIADKAVAATSFPREPYWRPVSRVDVDTLTQDTVKAMFAPGSISLPKMEMFDKFCSYILANIKAGLGLDADAVKEGEGHGEFVSWVCSTASSPACRQALELEAVKRIQAIDAMVASLSDVPEAQCIKLLHDNLSGILNGNTSSIKVLLEGNLLDELYTSGISKLGGYSQMQKLVSLLAHKNPRMRILELGAGIGGATACVLDTLGSKSTSRMFDQLVFTDSADWCLAEAQTKFSGHNGVTFQFLDVQKDPVSQGFDERCFDLIIDSGSLSQAEDMRKALAHVQKLLKPDGRLLLQEITRPRLGFDILSRTLTGKWNGNETFRDEETWSKLLLQSGFSGVDVSLRDYAREQAMSTVMLTSTTSATKQSDKNTIALQRDVYLVYREYPPPLARSIDLILSSQGCNTIYKSLMSHSDIPRGSHIISLIDIENSTLFTRGEGYFSAMQSMITQAALVIWVASANDISGGNSHSAAMRGILRSIATQHLLLKVAFFELDDTHITRRRTVAELISRKLSELHNSTDADKAIDRECRVQDGVSYIERFLPDDSLNEQFRLRQGLQDEIQEVSVAGLSPVKAQYKQPGLLSSLYFANDVSFLEPLKDDWVEVKVEAIGLNTKDIAVVTGKFDWDYFSSEAAGVVTRAGSTATNFKQGDRVFGMMFGNMGNYVRCPSYGVAKIPDGETFVGASSMPVVYLAAVYALQHLARLEEGESILIQHATGGLGMAVMRIARHMGAKIYATVGSGEKRKLLTEEFGVLDSHIFNSRDLGAIDSIMNATDGHGIDVILGSASGDIMHETWRCIAPLGRYIDVGRVDVLGAGKLGLEVFKKNATFSSFDIGYLYWQKPALLLKLTQKVMDLWTKGVIGPIERITKFDISRLEGALSHFSKGVHVGKIVVTLDNPNSKLKVAKSADRKHFDSNSAYILVGALGGVGRSLAVWMAQRGARHLVFISRSGTDRAEAEQTISELTSMGVEPQVLRCSVTDREAITSAVAEVSSVRPVKGVIHAAMVEGDAFFEKTSYSKIHRVLDPKVAGSINLHHATKHLDLDFFVMTSSIVGPIGTPSQGAYVAANAFQDAFARFRVSQGLPATALGLGLILEIGSVSDSIGFQDMLQRNATYGISETELLQLFEGALCQSSLREANNSALSRLDPGCAAQISLGFEPDRFVPRVHDGRMADFIWHGNTRFQAVVQSISIRAQEQASSAGAATGRASSMAAKLRNASSLADKRAVARDAVVERIAKLVSIEADDIDTGKPMTRYGVDSLVASEMRNWIIKSFGIDITLLTLLSKATKIDDVISASVAGVS